MAANYWLSSQLKYWTFDNLLTCPGPAADLLRISREDLSILHAYFALLLGRVGKKLSIRQKHIATAIMFFKRFYTLNSFQNTEPFLVATTAMYLAGKVDEYPYHITNVLSETVSALKEGDPSIKLPYDTADLADLKFYMLETFHGFIAVHHPYHPYSKYVETINIDSTVLQSGWIIINDTFMTDINLTHAPHMVALAALYMALANNEGNEDKSPKTKSKSKAKEVKNVDKISPEDWFAGLNVDLEEVAIISQKMMDFYHLYKLRYSNQIALHLLKSLQESAPTNS